MKHRIAVAAIAAAALIAGACGERDGGTSPLFTEPGVSGREPAYITTGSASIVDPRTHQLRVVKPSDASAAGVSASIASASGSGAAFRVTNGSPGIEKSEGYKIMKFVDASKRQHALVMLYPHFGGPPVAVQHYVDGVLASTTAYQWQRTSWGYQRASSLMRVVQKGQLVGTYSTTTTITPTNPGNGGGGGPAIPVRLERPDSPHGFDRVLGGVAYALAFSLAPQDASAQTMGVCTQEWLRFAAATATLIAIEFIVFEAPMLTPLLMSQYASAVALEMSALDALLNCVFNNWSGPEQFYGGGGGPSGGGSAGGGVDNTCLEGSYAAHCTTPFTL